MTYFATISNSITDCFSCCTKIHNNKNETKADILDDSYSWKTIALIAASVALVAIAAAVAPLLLLNSAIFILFAANFKFTLALGLSHFIVHLSLYTTGITSLGLGMAVVPGAILATRKIVSDFHQMNLAQRRSQ